MSSPYQKAYFLLSVADVKQLPVDEGIEIAIAGRSNAGKSSVINRITHNKKLARVSKTPGRTQHVNIFVMDAQRRLVDLPGYGYARATPTAKRKWQKTVDEYMRTRHSLKGLILVMDIRHPLKEQDIQLLDYCRHCHLPVHILLNKMDKLSKVQVLKTMKTVKCALTKYENFVTLQGFSALKGAGEKELHLLLDKWYHYRLK